MEYEWKTNHDHRVYTTMPSFLHAIAPRLSYRALDEVVLLFSGMLIRLL
jgi:hypothetical protein